MRILHVIETMAPRSGGPASVLKSLAQAQARLGHDVTIVTTNTDYPAGTLPVPRNVPVADGAVTYRHFTVQFRPLTVSLPMARALPGLIAAHDIVDIHGLYRFPSSYTGWLARRLGVPHIIRPHGSLNPVVHAQSSRSLRLKRLYERFFDFPNLRAAGALHFTTDEERSRVGYLGLRTPSFVIPNGLDWESYAALPPPGSFRAQLGIGADTPLVLFLGRLSFIKGLDLLIPAFAQIRRAFPGAVLALAGPDTEGYGAKLRALAASGNLRDCVRFVGMLSGDAMRSAYVDADVFALPSYAENFGMAVIEALACGTPVVISDQVNIFRDVAASGSGLVTPCDSALIAEAIAGLLREPARARAMGERGRPWVRDTYSWPAIVEQFDAAYRSVIARTPAAARAPVTVSGNRAHRA